MIRSTVLPSTFLLLVTLIFACPRTGTAQTNYSNIQPENVDEAIEILRDMYFSRDYELGCLMGKDFIESYQGSNQLMAWYLANRARTDESRTEKYAKQAVDKAEQLVAEHPNDPWAHFALTKTLSSYSEREEETMEQIDQTLAMNPSHPDFLWLKSVVLHNHATHEDVTAFVDSARQIVDKPDNLIFMQGLSEISKYRELQPPANQNMFKQALDTFSEARSINPDNVSSYYFPAFYLMTQNKMGKALDLFEQASDLTTSLEIHESYWRAIRSTDSLSQEQKKEMILSDIEKLQTHRPSTAKQMYRVASQYDQLGFNQKHDELHQQILEQHAKSVWAEWVLVNRYRAYSREHQKALIENPDSSISKKYKSMLWNFINRPTHERMTLVGDAYRNLFYLIREDSTVSPDTVLQVVNGMVAHEGINTNITHAGGPKLLAERGLAFERAKEITREGLEIIEEKINEYNERGSYDTDQEYREAMGWATGNMYDALGWVYFHEGKLDSAQKYLAKSYSLNNDSRENLYHLGKLHEKIGNNKKAKEYYEKGMRQQGQGENPSEPALKSLYSKMNNGTDGYNEYMANLLQETAAKRKETIIENRIEEPEPVPSFTLKKLEGGTYSSSALEGKISVINMWGKWCGPCVKEMPDVQKLYDKYKNDPEVQILTINNDENISELKEWLAEHKYNFPVLRDDGYLNEHQMYTFPTTWFIDQRGNIVFIKEGYTEELVKEFSWRIVELKSER